MILFLISLLPINSWKNKIYGCLIASYCFTFTADCGAPPPPVNGSLLQPHTNTTEGSVVVFQCDSGFVPESMMTAVCGRDGQWTPNPGGVTCSPRPTPRPTPTLTEASILTPSATPDFSGPGESQFLQLHFIYRSQTSVYQPLVARHTFILALYALYKIQCKHI